MQREPVTVTAKKGAAVTYREITDDEAAALQAFADAHGRSWRRELSEVYWYNARLWRGPDGSDDRVGYTLHGIRNNFGPTWLFNVCTIKAAPKAKRA